MVYTTTMSYDQNDRQWRFGFSEEYEEKGMAQTFAPFMNVYVEMLSRNGISPDTVGSRPMDIALAGATEYSVGEFSEFAHSLGTNIHPTVIDVRDMSQRFRESDVRFIKANVQDMNGKVPDNSYDVVFTHWLIHHLEDPSLFAKELFRITRPGGLLALVELHRHQSFINALKEVGFTDVSEQDVEGLSMEAYLRIRNKNPLLKDWRSESHTQYSAVSISARKL